MTCSEDRGQSTVEFALVLPVALVCLAVVLQSLLIVSAQITAHNDARLAVRAASMSPDPVSAAQEIVGDDDRRTSIDVITADPLVTVVLQREVRIMVPILRRFVPSIDVRSSLTMALEPPIHSLAGSP